MSTKPIVRATTAWLSNERHVKMPEDATVSPVDLGIAGAIRTGLSHYVSEAVEISLGAESRLAARWLCGGLSADAMAFDADAVDCVNCRLAAAVPQCPVVYFAWGEDDELLYVGSSTRVAARLRNHVGQADWWPAVRNVTFAEYDTESEARRAEIEAIQERPGRHNRLVLDRQPGKANLSLLNIVDSGAA